jgi:SAM-dependent methyltransferase
VVDAWGTNECLRLFAQCYDAFPLVFPPSATVLEIGCAEDNWQTPMLGLRPDLQITGIDWRACERPGVTVRGDVLVTDFPPASFDAVVGVSSIEHIGLGHYDGDPLDPDGDTHAMQRAARWLTPGGWIYLDVPYGPAYRVEGTSHRVYDDAAVRARLVVPGLRVTGRLVTTEGFPYIALRLTKDALPACGDGASG